MTRFIHGRLHCIFSLLSRGVEVTAARPLSRETRQRKRPFLLWVVFSAGLKARSPRLKSGASTHWRVNDALLQGEAEAGFAAFAVAAILQREGAAVGFGDLAAEHQADSRAAGLGGEEGDE